MVLTFCCKLGLFLARICLVGKLQLKMTQPTIHSEKHSMEHSQVGWAKRSVPNIPEHPVGHVAIAPLSNLRL